MPFDQLAHLVDQGREIRRGSLVDARNQRSNRAVFVFGDVGEVVTVVDDPAELGIEHLLLVPRPEPAETRAFRELRGRAEQETCSEVAGHVASASAIWRVCVTSIPEQREEVVEAAEHNPDPTTRREAIEQELMELGRSKEGEEIGD